MIQEELRRDERMYEEVVEDGGDPRVPRSQGPMDQVISVTFKYELDSKEGPSCYLKVLESHLTLLDM